MPRDAAERVRAVFDGVVADGLRTDVVAGASDTEIDAMALAQRARAMPAAVREVLRIMGRRHGLWLSGSSLGVTLDGETKNHAVAKLRAMDEAALADPEGLLVLVEHGAYTYHVVDGADQTTDDPPVWLITEGEGVARNWDSVTAWFSAISPDVRELREELEIRREIGAEHLPAWAEYLDAD